MFEYWRIFDHHKLLQIYYKFTVESAGESWKNSENRSTVG